MTASLSVSPVVQFAKLSGFSPIITTASKHNEAYLKSLGATHVIDRSTPLSEIPALIRQITSEPVKIAYDAISDASTQNLCYDVLAPGGQVVIGLPSEIQQAKLSSEKRIVSVFGNVHMPEQRPVGASFYQKVTELVANGEIKVRTTNQRSMNDRLIPVNSLTTLKCFQTVFLVYRMAWRD